MSFIFSSYSCKGPSNIIHTNSGYNNDFATSPALCSWKTGQEFLSVPVDNTCYVSIASKFVNGVHIDSAGMIYVSTDSGLSIGFTD